MKKAKGSISVFLALTITLVLSFCMVLIESARENTVLLKASVVFDTGINCLLAEYHQKLWEEYDLLYIDCSYGQNVPSYSKTLAHLENYIDRNLEYDRTGWLGLEYEDAFVSNISLATDMNAADFFRQAVSSVKDSIGIPYMESALEWLHMTEQTSYIAEEMSQKKEQSGRQIEEANGTEVEVRAAEWGIDKEGKPIILQEAEYETIAIDNPLDKMLSVNVLLRQITNDIKLLSNTTVEIQKLASNRNLAVGDSQKEQEDAGILDKLFFCNYIFSHFGSYADIEDSSRKGFQCEVEYLLGGADSDNKNLEIVLSKLLVLREVDNYLSLLQNEAKQVEAHGLAAAAASLAPWLEPVVYQALMLYWAYEESISDLQMLFNGGKIPLVKALSVESVSDCKLNYEEYLLILLLMQSKDLLTMRTVDLIELSIREIQDTFQMDACITSGKVEGTFVDIYNKKYLVSKHLKY